MEKIEALEKAIERNNLVGIYSVFYTIAHGDPNFSTNKFKETLSYVKSKNITGLMQEYDGEEFESEENWNEEYWALIASSLMDNFCKERIDHLEEVGKKVYKTIRRDERPRGMQVSDNNEGLNKKHNQSRNTVLNGTRGNGIFTENQNKAVKEEHLNKTKKPKKKGFLESWFGRK